MKHPARRGGVVKEKVPGLHSLGHGLLGVCSIAHTKQVFPCVCQRTEPGRHCPYRLSRIQTTHLQDTVVEHLAPMAKAADYVGNARLTCPRCRGNLIRRPRRFIDRLHSLITPVQRYRCDQFSCRWIGNIEIHPVEVHTLQTSIRHPFRKIPMLTLLNILLVATLLVLVLMAAFSASMTGPPPADMDANDTLPAKDKDWSADNPADEVPPLQTASPLAGALPGQYQSSRSRATLATQAASTPN